MKVWVEFNTDQKIIRIFKNEKAAKLSQAAEVGLMGFVEKKIAVGQIRLQVFKRAKFLCQQCGDLVTWQTGHLDEVKSRGRGGEISVDNCECLDAKCHILGPDSKHGKERGLKFGKE